MTAREIIDLTKLKSEQETLAEAATLICVGTSAKVPLMRHGARGKLPYWRDRTRVAAAVVVRTIQRIAWYPLHRAQPRQ